MDGDLSARNFEEMKGQVDNDLVILKCKLSDLTNTPSVYKRYIYITIPMLQNLLSYYKNGDGKTKKKVLSCIFSDKLILQKGRVATTPFSVPIQVLFKTTKVLQESKNKKEVKFDLLST